NRRWDEHGQDPLDLPDPQSGGLGLETSPTHSHPEEKWWDTSLGDSQLVGQVGPADGQIHPGTLLRAAVQQAELWLPSRPWVPPCSPRNNQVEWNTLVHRRRHLQMLRQHRPPGAALDHRRQYSRRSLPETDPHDASGWIPGGMGIR